MLLVLLVAQLGITNTAGKIPPAEALAILARMDSPSNWTNRFNCRDCDGPRATIVPYHPDEGPFGRFPVYVPPLAYSYYGSSYYGSHYAAAYTPIYPYGTNVYRYRTNISRYGHSGIHRGTAQVTTRRAARTAAR